MGTPFTSYNSLLAGAMCLCLLPAGASAQAGSRPPQEFHDAEGTAYAGSISSASEPMLPTGVLKLADKEQFLLWMELNTGTLNVLGRNANGGMDLVKVIPASIGKAGFGKEEEGDLKTPVGVYRLTSFLADNQLDDKYGLGAFPLNYPNVLDRRAGRTGSGIWLHGLPKDVSSRPLQDSDGCVVIDNASLTAMHDVIATGITHIVLSDLPLSWESAKLNDLRGAALMSAFELWRLAWQARDNPAYLAFYADDFSDFSRNKRQWSDYKSRVNDGKRWIEVGASQVSLFADPRQPELVTLRYYQDYSSNNYSWRGWKEQQWRETPTGWKIVYEGNG